MSNSKAENRESNQQIRREMSRHCVDCSEVHVAASHGVVHLHGRIRAMRGHEQHFQANAQALVKSLRSQSGVRDVIVEWTGVTLV